MTASASHLNLDSSGHPDVEAISECLEDLLSPEATAELTAHLSTCPECSEVRDTLDEIRTLLGDTGTPRLPEDIAARIDAALAAEAALELPNPPDSPESAAVATESPAASPVRSPAAASAPPSKPSTARPGPTGPAGRRTGRRVATGLRRAVIGLVTLAVAGLIGTAILRMPSTTTKGAASSSAGPAVSEQVFSAAGFTAEIQALLLPSSASGKQPLTAEPGKSPAESTLPQAVSQPTVPDCALAAVGRSGQSPLVSSIGIYSGTAVYALVFPDRKDPTHFVDAYLVNFRCTAPAGSTSPVLLQRTVPRQ